MKYDVQVIHRAVGSRNAKEEIVTVTADTGDEAAKKAADKFKDADEFSIHAITPAGEREHEQTSLPPAPPEPVETYGVGPTANATPGTKREDGTVAKTADEKRAGRK